MAKTTKTTGLEILPPDQSKDALEVIEQGAGLVAFLQGLVQFFLQASSLEANALFVLEGARVLVVPTTKADDAELQDFIRRARANRLALEAHWEITTLVSRLHRKLTAKRAVGVDALRSAEARATGLHQRYVEDEKLRAEVERRRLQAAEDERARLAREASLAEFEAAAVAAEENSGGLSDRERLVVTAVADGKTWLSAATAAGYREPLAQSARLKSSAKINHALHVLREARATRIQIEVLKAAPLPADIIEVAPALNKGDRERWSAQCVDIETFREAAFTDKSFGIPLDVFVVDPAALNRYARSLGKRIELWPGIVAEKKLTVV